MDKSLIATCVVVFILIVIFTVYILRRRRNRLTKFVNKQLWNNEKKSMAKQHIEEGVETSVNGPNTSVAYSMNVNINRWIYSKDRVLPGIYREIFTHGHGSYNSFEENDIVSIALEPFRNDIHIQINTILNDPNSNETKCKEQVIPDDAIVGSDGRPRNIEHVTLKYVPIAEDFHVTIVLSNKRIDAYLNGKLSVTKLLNGTIASGMSDTLPLKFFQGAPLKGFVSNFNYFNNDLTTRSVNDLFLLSKVPKNVTESELNHDMYDLEGGTCA